MYSARVLSWVWPRAELTARSWRHYIRRRPLSRAGSSGSRNMAWWVWTLATKAVSPRCQRSGASPDRTEDAPEATGWLDPLVLPQDGGGAWGEQVHRAACVGASAIEAAPAGSLHDV